MKTRGRTIFLSMMLIASLSLSLIPIFPGTHSYAASTTPPANFIVPVTPLTEIPDGYVGITSAEELDAVRNDLDGQYILMNDIVIYHTNWPDFPPIGASPTNPFTGVFDGNGHEIYSMTQNTLKSDGLYGGLFGVVSGGEIKNLQMRYANIVSTMVAGGIAGEIIDSTIDNCYVSGYINARPISQSNVKSGYAGGIVGSGANSIITNCFSTAETIGFTSEYEGETINCWVGGIAGVVTDTMIANCYNIWNVEASMAMFGNYVGLVFGQACAGGIVGHCTDGSVTGCYNYGSVKAYPATVEENYDFPMAAANAGGIVGSAYAYPGNAEIRDCYNLGKISAISSSRYGCNSRAGGILGRAETTTNIDNCYNMGEVIASDSYQSDVFDEFGLAAPALKSAPIYTKSNYAYPIGDPTKTVFSHCYYLDTTYTGDAASLPNQTKLTEMQMTQQSSFAGFDFANTWSIGTTANYPFPNLLANPYDATTYYRVDFETGGGTAIPSHYVKETYKLSEPTPPTRNGYVFGGWFADPAWSDSWSFSGDNIMADTTLYAKWIAPITAVASYNYNSIKISWAAAGGATSYRIYRATSAAGSYTLVNVASATARSYVNTGLVTGKTYYYKVSVVAGGKTYHHSAYKSAKAIPATPTVTLSKYSPTAIKVSWTGVSGATRYQIFRATSATGTYSYQYTASSTARSWVNTGLTAGKTYYYKVRAYHLEGTTKVYSATSAVKYLKI